MMDAEELLAAYAEGQRNFQNAQLGEADLKGADLSGIDLSRANLTAVDFSEAFPGQGKPL
jgi:2-iminobutanoate/2-iminopropanoate deaminase